MNTKKIKIMIIGVLFITLIFLNDIHAKNADNKKAEWTVICYLAGDNFLDWFMKENMKELIRTGSSDSVNLIVFLDTTDNETKVFKINKDDPLRIPTKIVNYSWERELNTGDPLTLINFASWAIKKYPARKYFLILGGYGEGWTGLLHDMNNGQGDTDILSLEELRYVLNDITKIIKDINGKPKIDVLGLDACYMGMLEVMYQVRDYADYLISSQNEEALDGWPYDKLLQPIIDNPNMDSQQLTSIVVDTYIDSVKGSPSKIDNVLTLSAVDLEFIDEIVREVDALSLFLLELQKSNPRKITFAERVTNKFFIKAHINNKYVPYNVFFDLNDFIENLRVGLFNNKTASVLIQQLSNLLSKAIIKEKHQALKGQYNLGIGGISLYFTGIDAEGYRDNDFSIDTHWDELIAERASLAQKTNKKE